MTDTTTTQPRATEEQVRTRRRLIDCFHRVPYGALVHTDIGVPAPPWATHVDGLPHGPLDPIDEHQLTVWFEALIRVLDEAAQRQQRQAEELRRYEDALRGVRWLVDKIDSL